MVRTLAVLAASVEDFHLFHNGGLAALPYTTCSQVSPLDLDFFLVKGIGSRGFQRLFLRINKLLLSYLFFILPTGPEIPI
jgi:hypothetical protein